MATSILTRQMNALSIYTRKQLPQRFLNTNIQCIDKQRPISSFSSIYPTTSIDSCSNKQTLTTSRCMTTRTVPTWSTNTSIVHAIPNNDLPSIQEMFDQLPPPLHRNSKLKPHITRKRIARLKTYIGKEKDIRHSPWRLNLVCQLITNLPVKEALMQLQFCQKMKAPLVATLVERTAKRAYHQDYLQMSQLEVAECFATHGKHLKRVKIMGRGRSGVKRRRFSHIRLVLREIDFDLKIRESYTKKEKMDWFVKKMVASKEHMEATKEREELEELEREAKEKQEKNKD